MARGNAGNKAAHPFRESGRKDAPKNDAPEDDRREAVHKLLATPPGPALRVVGVRFAEGSVPQISGISVPGIINLRPTKLGSGFVPSKHAAVWELAIRGPLLMMTYKGPKGRAVEGVPLVGGQIRQVSFADPDPIE